LILRTQAIHRPASERRPTDDRFTGVHGNERRAVGMTVGVTGSDDGQLIGVLPDLREEIRDQKTALSTWLELTETGREVTDFPAA